MVLLRNLRDRSLGRRAPEQPSTPEPAQAVTPEAVRAVLDATPTPSTRVRRRTLIDRRRAPVSPQADEALPGDAPPPAAAAALDSLGAFARGDGPLVRAIVREQSQPQAERVGGEYVHVSALLSKCLRYQHLARSHAVPVERTYPGMQVVWAMGRAMEAHIRAALIRSNQFRIMGRWECVHGHPYDERDEPGLLPRPVTACRSCGETRWTYHEFTLRDTVRKIVGNPDLLIDSDTGMRVVEIKSINSEGWARLDGPVHDHVIQAAAYQRLLRQAGETVDPQITVLYGHKDAARDNPFREFRITTTDGGIQNTLDYLWEQAAAMAAGRLPVKHTLCTGPAAQSRKASGCSLVGPCYAR